MGHIHPTVMLYKGEFRLHPVSAGHLLGGDIAVPDDAVNPVRPHLPEGAVRTPSGGFGGIPLMPEPVF